MKEALVKDVWAAGERYEPYVGRWSRRVAPRFVEWLGIEEGRDWLDVGCGTGALAQTIAEKARPGSLVGIDSSAGFVDYARGHIDCPQARFEVGDAQALPLGDASVDAAVSGLVVNFVPEPARMVAEMARVIRPGGIVALYVWDYAGEMQLMRHFWEAAVALDEGARALDERLRFPLCRPTSLENLLIGEGLHAVRVCGIDVETVFRDFDDYWSPFLGGQGPAPSYAAALSEERRDALREEIRKGLEPQPDGTIRLMARAWAVKGSRV